MISIVCATATSALGRGNSTARHHGEQRAQADEQRIDAIYYPLPPRRTASDAGIDVYPEDLLRQFLNYFSVMDYERAAESALRLIELVPDEPVGHYNYACSMARLRRVDEALAALDQAIECGWRNVDHLRIDPDFALLRDLPAFQNRLDSLERRIAAETIAPIPLRQALTETMRAELPSRIDALIAEHRVPGLTLTTIEPDGTSWTYATGVTDAESLCPMLASTLYRVDDAVDVLLLIALTQLDDAGIWSTSTVYEQMYAHHAAEIDGTQQGARGAAAGSRRVVLPGPDPYRRDHAVFHARGMLSLALERVLGVAVPRYVRTAILETLGLDDVYFGVLPGDRVGRLAAGHSQFGTPVQLPDRAGLYATSADLASILGSVLCGPAVQVGADADTRGLAPSSSTDPTSEAASNQATDQIMKGTSESMDGDSTEQSAGSVQSGTAEHDGIEQAMERASLRTTDAWDGRQVLGNLRAAKRASPAGLGLTVDLHATPVGERFILESNDAGMGCLIVGYQRTHRGVVILFNSERGLECARTIAREILGGV
ncbi:MAG: serine hydrolase [Phycisphaerales bacterium]|nr:serine hydrolase [Phycisphaerales bacterium]